MKVAEFRKDIKNQLDLALNGKDVLIERGGVIYQLTVKGPASVAPRYLADERLSNGICKIHGTPLDSRGKCLQKGCKYA